MDVVVVLLAPRRRLVSAFFLGLVGAVEHVFLLDRMLLVPVVDQRLRLVAVPRLKHNINVWNTSGSVTLKRSQPSCWTARSSQPDAAVPLLSDRAHGRHRPLFGRGYSRVDLVDQGEHPPAARMGRAGSIARRLQFVLLAAGDVGQVGPRRNCLQVLRIGRAQRLERAGVLVVDIELLPFISSQTGQVRSSSTSST